MLSMNVFAQEKREVHSKEEQIREILKEKMTPYELLDNENTSPLLKTTSSKDQRVSTISGYQEGEVSIAVNPNDSSKLVLSYMQQGSGLTIPAMVGPPGRKALLILIQSFPAIFPGIQYLEVVTRLLHGVNKQIRFIFRGYTYLAIQEQLIQLISHSIGHILMTTAKHGR